MAAWLSFPSAFYPEFNFKSFLLINFYLAVIGYILRIIMPGPIFSSTRAVSDSIDTFHSCDDVQEAWACNGNSLQDNFTHAAYKKTTLYINGKTTSRTSMEDSPNAEGQGSDKESSPIQEATDAEGGQVDMEIENEIGKHDRDQMAETISVPIVEARLSVDITSALTRQKIASVQRGRTLSYADKDDSEEAPTRRSRPFAHNRDSMELGGILHNLPPVGGSAPSLPPRTEKPTKVSRNPSYHSAVKASLAVEQTTSKTTSFGHNNGSSSSEGSPTFNFHYGSADNIIKIPTKSTPVPPLPILEKNQPLDLPAAANMPRSASFSGGGLLSPSSPTNSSFIQVYGRRGSISQPSTPVTKRSELPKPLPTEITTNAVSSVTGGGTKLNRGSAISKSFRRFFSTPLKTSSPAISTHEDFWPDTPDAESPTPSESRPTSRLRKLSTNLSRKLSTRSKMSNSYTFPVGPNGHGQGINGEAIPDSSTLVDYEELMKLFSCSGCQSIMVPPLYQCRKGHLVCNTCRFSLKQVCPVCKQRFSDNTNLMMEQVCHLVKFPCKWSNRGCPEFHAPKSRIDHEHFCVFRPLLCHHASRGCDKVLLFRDMEQHIIECEYRDK